MCSHYGCNCRPKANDGVERLASTMPTYKVPSRFGAVQQRNFGIDKRNNLRSTSSRVVTVGERGCSLKLYLCSAITER